VAHQKALRPTAADAGREPHVFNRAGEPVESIANPERIVGQDLARSNSLVDLAARIHDEWEIAENHFGCGLQHALTAGRLLLEAKAQLDHGEWLPWLRDHCRIPERTAQLYMRCAIHAEELKSERVADFRGAVALIAKVEKEARVEAMIQRRHDREIELADATAAASKALGKKLYGVLYADPPWVYDNKPMGDVARAVEEHYPTMPLDEIKSMAVPAADDCVLFLWATVPLLPEALAVMTAWGFTYKSMITWVKDKWGIGYWVRSQCEHLLIGTRGNIPSPAPGDQLPAKIDTPCLGHSEKPDIFAEHIERLFPNVPKLEMFAREPREGWDTWGNEVTYEIPADLAIPPCLRRDES
jgi:N6-adenosine-specific RNA methylase IME4